MQRVMIIGPCGAGKSTLSFTLAGKLGLPLTHMDKLNWLPGWVDGGNDRVRAKLADVLKGERWLIEGNYGSTMPMRLKRADTVVYLDFPIRLCLWRLIKRVVTGRGKTRPDMTADCPERFDLKFFTYVMGWNYGPRPRTEEALKGHETKVIRLRSPKELARWVAKLEVQT
jgi:adenylate kinase family enzyme